MDKRAHRTAAHQHRELRIEASKPKRNETKSGKKTHTRKQKLIAPLWLEGRERGREREGGRGAVQPGHPFAVSHIFTSVTCALKHQHHDGIQGTEAQRGSSSAEVGRAGG